MRRTLFLVLTIALISFTSAACGSEDTNDNNGNNSTVNNSTENNSTENNSTENNSTENNSTENNSTENNSTENNSTENNSTENNSTENNSTENNSTENNSTENNSTPGEPLGNVHDELIGSFANLYFEEYNLYYSYLCTCDFEEMEYETAEACEADLVDGEDTISAAAVCAQGIAAAMPEAGSAGAITYLECSTAATVGINECYETNLVGDYCTEEVEAALTACDDTGYAIIEECYADLEADTAGVDWLDTYYNALNEEGCF